MQNTTEFFSRAIFITLFIFISLYSALSAQSRSVLRLVITETGGQPVVGANILLYQGDSEEFDHYGVTNRDGFLEFRNLEQGTYRIRVSFVGFRTLEESIDLGTEEIVVERYELEEAVGELDELEVVGEAAENTGSVGITRIRSEELSRLPSASLEGDLMAYVQTMPGVVRTGDQGGDLYIRGGTPAQNLVLMDNIPLVKPFHISNLFSAFPEKAVNDVQVMAGGFDNRYMNSISAVMDVNLKTGNLNKAAGSVSFGPYLSTLYAETPLAKGRSSLLVSGRYSTIDRFSGYMGSEQQEIQFYDLIARYTLQGEDFMCNASGIITGDEGKINPSRDLTLEWSNTGFGIRCFGFDETFDHPFEISVGFSDFENSEGNGNITERIAGVTQGYLRMDMQEQLLNLRFDYGLNVMFQSFQAELNEQFTTFDEGVDVISSIIQLYLKTRWQPGRWFVVEPGIGTQISTQTEQYGSTFEPRVRIQINPLKNNRMELSASTGLYSQNMEGVRDLRDAGSTFTLYTPPTEGVPLSSAVHAIFRVKNRWGRHWTTHVEGYYKENANTPVPEWTPETGVETQTVPADGISYGLDLRIEYNSPSFYWYVGYGLGEVEYRAAGRDLGSWLGDRVVSYNPAHDQRHKINTFLNYQFKGATASISWEFGSGLPYTQIYATNLRLDIPDQNPINEPGRAIAYFDQPYTERLPVYHRLDFSIKRFFDLGSSLRLGAEAGAINAYDRINVFYLDTEEFEVVNQSRFLPYISVSLNINGG
jgi:hypothetical protein